MKIKKTKILIFGLMSIFILYEQFFYFTSPKIAGIYLKDIALLILLFLMFWTVNRHGITKKGIFLGLSFTILAVISSFIAYFKFSQSIINGVSPQRHIIVILISICCFYQLLFKKILTIHEINKIIIILAKFEIVIYVVQYFLAVKGIYFLELSISQRGGNIRLISQIGLIIYLLFYLMDKIMHKYQLKDIIWLGLAVFYFIFVSQTRMLIIGIFVPIVFSILLWKKAGLKKIFFIVMLVIILGFILNTDIVQNIINVISGDSDMNLEIRALGRTHYLNSLKHSLLFGLGYPVTFDALVASGINRNFYLNDNGIFGFAYIYGLTGVCWAIFMNISFLYKSFKIYYKKNNYFYLMYSLYLIVTSGTMIHWYWDPTSTLLLSIIFTNMIYELKK